MRRRNVDSSKTTVDIGAATGAADFSSSRASGLIPGIGPEGCRLPSPSRINTLPLPVQALVVGFLLCAMAFGTDRFVQLFVQKSWCNPNNCVWYFPALLGAAYASVGLTHFVGAPRDLANIVPYPGCWGIWWVPGSARFHVFWTGILEIVGGIGLLAAGVLRFSHFIPYAYPHRAITTKSFEYGTHAGLESDCAFLLFWLTAGVTPANLYMFTHGARMPLQGDPMPTVAHLLRWTVQCLLLAMLYRLGEKTFEANLGSSFLTPKRTGEPQFVY